MEGVWAEEYEEDDFIGYFSEAEEEPEPQRKKTKLIDPNDPNQVAKEPKKSRVVQNPRPKLDVERLLSDERGLPELLRMSSEILFKPGKEIEGMRETLHMMEHWSHRLFPKFTFDDFLTKCESLGKKRPVKTHLRKVRIGMIPI